MGERLELVIAVGGAEPAASSEPPPPPVTDNVFIPADRDLGECITAVPRPGCGSDARSDWHQGLVLGVMVAGLVVIGWRIVRGVRRREAKPNDLDVMAHRDGPT
jgi:hypothetical protein